MFEPLPPKFSFPEAEQRVLEFWRKHDIFGQSLAIRRDAPRFVFYEGPPTANGLPHPGHCLTRAIKDLFPRYQTMCGKLVERKAGWDTHGLPVEVEVCKQLGIHTKEEIEAFGVEKFVHRCIESVFRYTREWEQMTRRLGFWVNLEEAYVTYHQSYVESVWWGLKTLFERGLLYQGHKVVWWWAQGGTALSSGEVGEGYRTVQDPSVYVRFPLRGNEGTRDQGIKGELPHDRLPAGSKVSLLVWTTTPWTLISNHFAAVGPDVDYALVHDTAADEYFIMAAALVQPTMAKVKHEFEIVGTYKGSDFVGLVYQPPFDSYSSQLAAQRAPLKSRGDESLGWRILPADFIDLATGTGIVHIAPAYGEVDFNLLQEERKRFTDELHSIPLLNAVAPNGTFNADAPAAYQGRWVKECDKDIIRELKERGLLLHQETIEHEYPFCPRAEEDALIQYARESWFVRTSQFKEEFLKNNGEINWLPDHIREGRFGDFLRNNVDWALSRERYWGTPLPIWKCPQCGKMEALGSLDELRVKPGATDATPEHPEGFWVAKAAAAEAVGHPLPSHLCVHKPYIDAWTYDAACCPGARMHRVPEVIDCWWDAGSMPFAQWGFPHAEGSVERFTERFPADFISEAIDQTRGWFYGLLAISTLLFGQRGVAPAGSVDVPSARPAFPPQGASPKPDLASPSTSGSVDVPSARPTSSHRGVLRQPITEILQTRRRWRIPHWEVGGSTYFITFRLLRGELAPDERSVVLDACKHWDGARMLLHAATVMPDHVHLLMTPLEETPGKWWSLADLLHSIKGFTAKALDARRGTSGSIWQREYYDRIIRNESDFEEKWRYVVENPLRRGFDDEYEWVWVEDSHARRSDAGSPPTDGGTCGQDVHTPPDLLHPEKMMDTPYPHPYRTCIVLGHVMGEDGFKMSKRTKNYKEPGYIFDTYGADAMRWYFFSAQTPWTSVRFQEAAIRDSHREFLVRLYNVLSFFNIYANIDGFVAHPQHGSPWRPTRERGELDRWIVSELMRTIAGVREKLDAFENYPAAGRINEFVDALSNWYVRRSRDRFWKSAKDQDKWDAYHTLYGVLWTLSQLIAPFTPFFAETMYQNLAGAGNEGPREQGNEGAAAGADFTPSSPRDRGPAPVSVHLCDYPVADPALIDEKLAEEMDLVRDIVSLGRAARAEAKLKVRQPLALAEIILVRQDHTAWLEAHSDLIAEELNIKRVEFTTEADHYVTYQVKPNFKTLGPKLGALAKQVGPALAKADPADARRTLGTTGALVLDIAGQKVHLDAADVDIRLEARPGWSAAQGRAGVVVVKTELTDELREEGTVRELIHHVQALRRDKDLPYEARITLWLDGPAELIEVIRRHEETLRRECLVDGVRYAAPPGEAAEAKVETFTLRLALEHR